MKFVIVTPKQNTMKTKSAKIKHVIDLVHCLIPFWGSALEIFYCFDGVGQNKKISQAPNPKKGLSTAKSTLPAYLFTIDYK